MVVWGVQHWGYPAYATFCVLVTIPFAVASWWLVEKHALALKNFDPVASYRQSRQGKGKRIESLDT
jgi:peptidoglycan/LPS O-acetylase OafA/YrhL